MTLKYTDEILSCRWKCYQTRSRQISILKQYNSLADKIWYSWTYWVLTLKHINKCMLSGLSRPELNTSTQDICSREHSAGERHPISHSKGKKCTASKALLANISQHPVYILTKLTTRPSLLKISNIVTSGNIQNKHGRS